ncbi:hypothetical protein, partial [Halobacterium salinarum]|uniref:hypothetical protein n=1 Tax=Halobacterium salinarum TaxID=2242 RepID=UPI002553D13B
NCVALLKSLEVDNFHRFRSTQEIHGSVNTGDGYIKLLGFQPVRDANHKRPQPVKYDVKHDIERATEYNYDD